MLLLRAKLAPLLIASVSLSYNVAAARAATGDLGTFDIVRGHGQGHEVVS